MLWFRKRHPAELRAELVANTIQHQLTRLNLAYRDRRGDVNILQEVEFVQPLVANPEQIKLEIDINRLPRAVTLPDLRDSKVLETLTAACKMPVSAEHKKGPNGGFWYVVEITERSLIPKTVKFEQMQPPTPAPALLVPIGVGENKKAHWEDLRKLPHLLIAGATGQGKSVMVNALLCFLARRHKPDILQLWLVDLKGGMELSFYEGLPHIPEHCFVTRAGQLPQLLADLQREMDRRTSILRGQARDIDEYNASRPAGDRIPYIVLVIDEIANAMLNRKKCKAGDETSTVASLTESLLADLAARARATGIHMIISTQRPSVDVVTGLIKANFPCRIAFGTASEVDSRVIIDAGDAAGLPVGRMRFRRNMELLELQAPYLSDDDVRATVRAVVAGDYQEVKSPGDREREVIGYLLKLSEDLFSRRFAQRDFAKYTRGIVSDDQVKEIAARLETEGILKKQWGPKPRIIKVSRGDWEAKYPPCDLRVAR